MMNIFNGLRLSTTKLNMKTEVSKIHPDQKTKTKKSKGKQRQEENMKEQRNNIKLIYMQMESQKENRNKIGKKKYLNRVTGGFP